MLSRLRHLFIDSWFGRILIGLIFVVFVGWGVSDIFMNIWSNGFNGDPNIVATVGDRKISVQELDNFAQKEINQLVAKQGFSDPTQIPPIEKSMVVRETLQKLILQNILVNKSNSLIVEVPDAIIRDEIWNTPELQTNGKFDRAKLNYILRRANLSEANFLKDVRDQLSIQSMINPMVSGIQASESFIKPYYQFLNQTRQLNFIFVPFNYFHANELFQERDLKRYYDNHLWEFTIPEYRRVKLVILTPKTIAKSLEIDDKTLLQYYDAKKNDFVRAEARNFQIVTFNDQKQAQLLFDFWKVHNDWSKVMDFAQRNKGTAIEMKNLQQSAIPLPELGKTVFSINSGSVAKPFQTTTGWSVIKVTQIIPPKNISFEQAKSQLREEMVNEQAMQTLGNRVSQLQNIIAGSKDLEKITSDIGVAAIEGTLNEQGLTLEGDPAPIPAEGKFRQNMLNKIFSSAKNAYPSLIAGDNNAYYAFIVENILPAHQESYEQAKNKVIKTWKNANIQRQANIAATEIYKTVLLQKKRIEDVKSDFALQVSQPFSRQKAVYNLVPAVQNQAFLMNIGDVTMMETPDGFIVASLKSIKTPNPKDNMESYQQLKDNLTDSMKFDIQASYAISLEQLNKSIINQKALDALINQLSH